ncbi:MAG: hypothetical protein KDK25_13195, partial [Leptospiraceae bacterium]|nr:hypothetical protein [Leptospiraceae bacterium]
MQGEVDAPEQSVSSSFLIRSSMSRAPAGISILIRHCSGFHPTKFAKIHRKQEIIAPDDSPTISGAMNHLNTVQLSSDQGQPLVDRIDVSQKVIQLKDYVDLLCA